MSRGGSIRFLSLQIRGLRKLIKKRLKSFFLRELRGLILRIWVSLTLGILIEDGSERAIFLESSYCYAEHMMN